MDNIGNNMEETPAVVAEVVEAVAETPVNPMIAIDSTVGTIVACLALIYVLFIICFPKYRWAHIGICLGLAAANFFRLGLGVQITMPIVLGCVWLFNAAFSYWSMKSIERLQARTDQMRAEIERIQAEINRVDNRTYTSAGVWPPNPE